MVYDDDTYEPQHLDIQGSERHIKGSLSVPADVAKCILKLRSDNKNWTPEDIFKAAQKVFKQRVTLDHVHHVLRTGGRSQS